MRGGEMPRLSMSDAGLLVKVSYWRSPDLSALYCGLGNMAE